MPGPRNRRKTSASANRKSKGNPAGSAKGDAQATSLPQCLTLEEDEITRCGQPATEGRPKPERCKVHHGQYRIMYKKYKEASKIVNKIKDGAELPTKEDVDRYTDWRAALKKARWVRTYLEAIRVERTGRDIHQKRFFLKGEFGTARAYELYQPDDTLHATRDHAPSTTEVELGNQSKRATKEVLESAHDLGASRGSTTPISRERDPTQPPSPAVGDEDLIDMSLRAQKEHMIAVFKPFIAFESYMEVYLAEDHPQPETEYTRALAEIFFFIYQQFARRIIFHEPTLFMKSLGKISFKDFILSDDFSIEDIFTFIDLFFIDLFLSPLGFPLQWFKDSVLDALAMSRHGTAAGVGSAESRIPMLGGWVFNRSHTADMSNKAWWLLLTLLHPPPNVENRFVRLCNNLDDLLRFLAFEPFGLVPSPNFCQSCPHSVVNDLALSRNYLSLCGVVVVDILSPLPPSLCGPFATTRRATKRGCAVWSESETRGYMFGAVRNEPDPFVDAFLRELRARPDLFQVVLRSETAPDRQVEMFGSGPSNDDALPVVRWREFEAPPFPTCPSAPASTPSGNWEVKWSAMDVLYGRRQMGLQGYLVQDNPEGLFFRFPVKYFVILDPTPNRNEIVLAKNVTWAALRAGGYAEGNYTPRKYLAATDTLVERCAQERSGWMPREEWCVRKMPDVMKMQDRVCP